MKPFVFEKNGKKYSVEFQRSTRYRSQAHFHSLSENTIVLEMPMDFPEDYARKYVEEHQNRLLRYFHEPKQTNKEIYLFGEKYEIEEEHGYFHVKGAFSYRNEEEKKRMLYRLLHRYFDERFPQLEKMMKVTPPYRMSIHDVCSRYGSNSRKTHTIAFSLSLVHYSKEMIDSVIVHELAHHYHFDHSSKFYKVVYQYCPNYDELRAKMIKGVYK